MNFTYKIGVYATLTREEADMVYEHLLYHPDTKRYTTSGHFGFSFVNFYKGSDVERDFSFDDIDVMLKALESPLYVYDAKEEQKVMKASIIWKLEGWTRDINAEYKRVKICTTN